jgi:hypothetical protein
LLEIGEQRDQSGPIFTYWAIVYFAQCFENYRSISNFGATFFHGASYVLIRAKNWLGDILGDIFTNSSGHPVGEREFHLNPAERPALSPKEERFESRVARWHIFKHKLGIFCKALE